MTAIEIQWKCKTPHRGCEAQDWKPYKSFSPAEADRFMNEMAQNSHVFDYRKKPDANTIPAN